MPPTQEPDGKNSLVGEFLLALARAPEAVQEAIIVHGIKTMKPFASSLVNPYPMLSHLMGILERENLGQNEGHSNQDDDSDAA